jgi:Flp pilus assembly protein TadB
MLRRLALAVAVVAIAVAAAAWLEQPDDISAREAVRAATGAFEAAGLEDASVDLRAHADTYESRDGERIRVWRTSAQVEEGPVELWLAREDGEPVYLDDRSPDGTAQLLTDEQFEAIGDHFENPALGRQVRRNLLLTLGAALVLAVIAVFVTSDLTRGERR